MITSFDDLRSTLLKHYHECQMSRKGITDKSLAQALGLKSSKQLIVLYNALYFVTDWMQTADAGTTSRVSKIMRVPLVKQFFQAVFVAHIPKYLVYSRTWTPHSKLPKPKLNQVYQRRKASKMLNWSGLSKPKYLLDQTQKQVSVTTIAESIDPKSIVFFNSYNSYKSKYKDLHGICTSILTDGLSDAWAVKMDRSVEAHGQCASAEQFIECLKYMMLTMEKFNYEYEVLTLQQEARCRIVRIGSKVLSSYEAQ
jgi:hypothetical protein